MGQFDADFADLLPKDSGRDFSVDFNDLLPKDTGRDFSADFADLTPEAPADHTSRAYQADVRKAEKEPIDRPARMTLTRAGQPKLEASTEDTFEKEADWSEVIKSLPAQLVGGAESALANLKEMLGRNAVAFLKQEAELAAKGGEFDFAEFNKRAMAMAEKSVEKSAAGAKKSREILADVTPRDMTTAQQVVSSLAQSAGPTATGIAVGIATRSPVAAMAIAGGGGATLQAGFTYGTATEKGAGHEVARRASLIDGILEGVGEALPLRLALKPGTAAAKRVAQVITTEAGQEGATQIGQDLNAYLSYDPNMTLEQALQNLKVAVLAGAAGGSVYGAAGAALESSRATSELRKVAEDIEATDTTAGTEQIAVDLLRPENAQRELVETKMTAGRAVPVVSALVDLTRQVQIYDGIDSGEKADLKGASAIIRDRARDYEAATPEQRVAMREEEMSAITDLAQHKDELAAAWGAYAKHIEDLTGTAPSHTDIKSVMGFIDQFGLKGGTPYAAAHVLSGTLDAALQPVEISTPTDVAPRQAVLEPVEAIETPAEVVAVDETPEPTVQAVASEAPVTEMVSRPQPTKALTREPVRAPSSFEDIPADLEINEPTLIEDTGETVQVKRNAREAFKEADQRVNRYRALIECLGRAA